MIIGRLFCSQTFLKKEGMGCVAITIYNKYSRHNALFSHTPVPLASPSCKE
jgi:hypothetical protein